MTSTLKEMADSNENNDNSNTLNTLNYPAVNRVAIKMPPFWKTDPSIWFAQVEAQFDLSGITNETTKYNHIVSAVDTDILSQVSDIIQKPPETDRY